MWILSKSDFIKRKYISEIATYQRIQYKIYKINNHTYFKQKDYKEIMDKSLWKVSIIIFMHVKWGFVQLI